MTNSLKTSIGGRTYQVNEVSLKSNFSRHDVDDIMRDAGAKTQSHFNQKENGTEDGRNMFMKRGSSMSHTRDESATGDLLNPTRTSRAKFLNQSSSRGLKSIMETEPKSKDQRNERDAANLLIQEIGVLDSDL